MEMRDIGARSSFNFEESKFVESFWVRNENENPCNVCYTWNFHTRVMSFEKLLSDVAIINARIEKPSRKKYQKYNKKFLAKMKWKWIQSYVRQ